jgi:hypothetical protein
MLAARHLLLLQRARNTSADVLSGPAFLSGPTLRPDTSADVLPGPAFLSGPTLRPDTTCSRSSASCWLAYLHGRIAPHTLGPRAATRAVRCTFSCLRMLRTLSSLLAAFLERRAAVVYRIGMAVGRLYQHEHIYTSAHSIAQCNARKARVSTIASHTALVRRPKEVESLWCFMLQTR